LTHIALLFEFGTLNGGEQSMLAVIDRPGRKPCSVEFTAIAPATGRLAEALQQRNIRHIPINLYDDAANRLAKKDAAERVQQIVNALQPDLLHANSLSMGRLTGVIADQLDCPTVAHLRDIIKLNQAAVADLNRNTRLVAVSQATRDYHLAQGLDAQKCIVIYNGVDCELFQPGTKTGILHKALGLPDDCFLVANIGQLGLRKRQNLLLDAWQHVARVLPNSHLLLIGERNSSKPESVEYEQNLHHQVQELGLQQRVHWLGYRDDLPQLYNEFDLLVHCAHQEPLGRVLLEAAAAGVPIVATDVGGTSEILQHGQSALLVPAKNAEALRGATLRGATLRDAKLSDAKLSDAIVKSMSEQPLRVAYAANARSKIVERFSISTAAEKLSTLWQEITRL